MSGDGQFNHGNYRVAETMIGGVRISTVWVGPGRFETMVFGGERHGYSKTYATEAEARAGHVDAWSVVSQ